MCIHMYTCKQMFIGRKFFSEVCVWVKRGCCIHSYCSAVKVGSQVLCALGRLAGRVAAWFVFPIFPPVSV